MEMLAGAMAAAVGGQCSQRSQHAQQPLPPRSVAVAVGAMVAVEVDAVVAVVLVAASTVVAPVSSATATVSTHMALACSRQQWRCRWREPGGVVATMHTMPVQPFVVVPAGVVADATAPQPALLGCSAAASADLCAQRAAVAEAGGGGATGQPRRGNTNLHLHLGLELLLGAMWPLLLPPAVVPALAATCVRNA